MMSANQTHRFVMFSGRFRVIGAAGTSNIRHDAMRLSAAIGFLFLLAMQPCAGASSPGPQQADIPLANGTLHAQLFKPDGPGPFPAVIALHGCGGLSDHDEPVQARYRDWAEQLLKAGSAVLLPDSYGSREL